MTNPWDQDPQLLINGEPASETELGLTDTLASSLLEPAPTQVIDYYFVETGSELGPNLRLETGYEIDGEATDSCVCISVSDGDIDNTCFSIFYRADNTYDSSFLASDEYTYEDAEAIAQALADCGELDSVEQAIVRHCIKALQMLQDKPVSLSTQGRPVAQIVREKVAQKARFEIRTKEYQMPIDETVISVSHNEVRDLSGKHDDDGIPTLQIELEDRGNQKNYLYTRSQDPECEPTLQILFTHDATDEPFEDEEPEDDGPEVAAFKELLGSDRPSSHDVGTLTGKLLEAMQIDGLM